MFGRMLVPLDGSADAESVLGWLSSWNLAAPLTLLHCLPASGAPGRFESAGRARDYLERVSRTLPGSPEIQVCSGAPAEQILAAADEGCVVLGTSAEFGAVRQLGRVAREVAQASPVPVMLVKTPAKPSRRRMRRMLAPLEAELGREDVLEILRLAARDLRAEAILLHVGAARGQAPPGASSYSDQQLRLIGEVWKFLKEGIAARSIMTRGELGEETVSHEQSLDVDLVAVSRSDAAWRAIVGRCERPVLLYDCTEAPVLASPAKEKIS